MATTVLKLVQADNYMDNALNTQQIARATQQLDPMTRAELEVTFIDYKPHEIIAAANLAGYDDRYMHKNGQLMTRVLKSAMTTLVHHENHGV